MNQSLHNLVQSGQQQPPPAGSGGQQKQHPMHQQLHHTLHHPLHPQQPPVHANQAMLQYHQTLHHPYSTLHQQQLGLSSQHQQQQQQLGQQPQYNMNSDYSTSSNSYHIYDQISDLIIIKQQRMERKRQQEHRRKVILLALAATLLVATLIFLAFQTLVSAFSSSASLSASQQQVSRSADASLALRPPSWPQPPPADGNAFDGSLLGQFPAPPQQPYQVMPPAVRLPSQRDAACNSRGTVIMAGPAADQPVCKCDPGFGGERCEYSTAAADATYQQPNKLLHAKCLLTNCNNNGHCNHQGRCLCSAGFTGHQCQYRLPPPPASPQPAAVNIQSTSVISAPTSLQQLQLQQHQQQQQDLARCALEHCNGNGQCEPASSGSTRCRCLAGFTGDNCQARDFCAGVACTPGQGRCLPATGECQCKFGFRGVQCELRDDQSWQRLFNCSHHGQFDPHQRKCICQPGWAGFDCAEERCEARPSDGQPAPDCGPAGLYDCRQERCVCQDGYSGDRCQVQQCSSQCLRHGQCQDGVCVCQPGYYGKHCSLNGCPAQCSGRGQCVRLEGLGAGQPEWRCQCQAGATGDDCGSLVERQCDDGLDNDQDGLVDCADSECCADRACQNSTLCMKSPDPLDILMRKQPPPPTSSFFQRMQFLIEKFSSQIYSNPKDFNDSVLASRYADRASVVRGRVTYLKQGITGVRVSVVGQLNLGVTFTRDGGFFDLMVNGGGAVLLEFGREPFATQQKAVRVPWNEIVLMDPLELAIAGAPDTGSHSGEDSPSCLVHNYRLMRPQIVAAPRSTRRSHSAARIRQLAGSGLTSRALILRDSALVQHSILLPGSASRAASTDQQAADTNNQSLALVYISSRANEFMSTISLQLTPPASDEAHKLPAELRLIHLKIVIEGNLFEQVFEPQTNLSFTYAWNRRNVYRQKSFGLSTASVAVGYEYFDCRQPVWSTKLIQLPGHDLSISDIGSQWNLNIHHRYNYRDAILQRGDGQNFHLRTDKARVVQPVLGDGYPRQPICQYCDGATSPAEQRLLRPQALVAAPDGSLYVADANLIRRVEWAPAADSGRAGLERVVRTVLELPAGRTPASYGLALNLVDNKLYMNDPDRHQILQVREQGKLASTGHSTDQQVAGAASQLLNDTAPEESLGVVVGSGARCQPDEDGANCGDGQPARAARLVQPRALAFDLAGRMYIADGPNVRMVDADQKIYTILGDYGLSRHTKFPCSGEAVPMHKFVPRAPSDLALSPIDDTLHLLDDNVVYKITRDKRVQVVAGRLAHCAAGEQPAGARRAGSLARATETHLQSAQSIAFNQLGDLFIGEDDPKQAAGRVLLVSPEDDTIQLYAGLPGPTTPQAADEYSADEINSQSDKQRASNSLPVQQPTRALDYKFSSVAAMAVDQQGKLLVADRLQLRLLSVEPELATVNAAGEYELQSPDNADELLVFNRYGHHVATRELGAAGSRQPNKYTFSYNVNTSFGQLAAVSYASGNKISIYRDGPQHSVKLIETALGGQCKLEVGRAGQVLSISTSAPNATKTQFAYQVEGGLLKQSRDQASGEIFDFGYDEHGRAATIQHSSPRLPAPVECRLTARAGQLCSGLIVAE